MKSMTGYGLGEIVEGEVRYVIEIQSYNRKFIDINVVIPREYIRFEKDISRMIMKEASRGRINVFVKEERIASAAQAIRVDKELAKAYKEHIEALMQELSIKDSVRIEHLLLFKDIFQTPCQVIDYDVWFLRIQKALNDALAGWNSMREQEGRHLGKICEERLNMIESSLDHIQTLSPRLCDVYKDKLYRHLEHFQFVNNEEREVYIIRETAHFIEKMDITEEIERLRSHVVQFRGYMKQRTQVGRTLDFLVQEMIREVNTIGSKSGDIEITDKVVVIKSELERIREQIQNIE